MEKRAILVMTASEMAKLTLQEGANGQPDMVKFGAIIEEAITYKQHPRNPSSLRRIGLIGPRLLKGFGRAVAAMVREAELPTASWQMPRASTAHCRERVLEKDGQADDRIPTAAAVNPYQRAKTTPMADAQERDVRLTGLYRTEGGQWPWDYEDVMLAPADGEQVLRDIGAIPVE